jgi:transmembrane 9 superfamily protein 2/4
MHTNYAMVTDVNREPQEASGKVLFTYDVVWIETTEITWASRWNIYLDMKKSFPSTIRWFSIVRKMIIVLILSSVVAAILVRNLRRDINRYNTLATDEEKSEELEEYGWKLVHADVFRPPSFAPMFLAVCCGTGAQLLGATLFTIIFSSMGFMSPARRGHLLIAELILFVIMGSVGGYIMARLYKTFKGKSWQTATFCMALGYPGLAFFTFSIINVVAISQNSTDAVPFVTILVLMILWLGISTPMVFLGAYYGYKQDAIEFPVNSSTLPRQVPDQPWFLWVFCTAFICGILPYGSCVVELQLILAAMWEETYYYVFGFLLVVYLMLLITCAEITVLFTYFQLCNENYHWWWRSFINGGAAALWVFLYSITFFRGLETNDNFATYVLYFGYMALVCAGLFTITGAVGMGTSLWFNKTIFSSIKIVFANDIDESITPTSNTFPFPRLLQTKTELAED